jgi:hypothetical protein
MATSVTQSLFGMSPQAIQAQRAAELNKRAMDYAQLDPMQASRAATFRAGSLFGDAAAGAMGYEDPEIAQAKQIQGMLGGANMNDPDSLMQIAQRIQSVNPAAAQELAQRALNMRKTQAEIRAKEAEPLNKLIQAGKYTPESVAAYEQTGRISDLALTESETKFSTDAEEVARELHGKSFKDLTPEEANEVNILRNQRRVQEKQAGRAQVTVSPTLKQAGAVTGLVKSYDDLTQKERESLQSAGTAKTLVNEAMSGNSVAWEGARTVFARAVGEGKLSNEDIRRTGVDPRLVQGTLDWINKKTSGVPTPDIQRQLFAAAGLLEQRAVEKINETSTRTRAVAKLEGVPDDQMDVLFPKINIDRSPRKQPGSGSTVNWSDLK